jgi:hypothetical protein
MLSAQEKHAALFEVECTQSKSVIRCSTIAQQKPSPHNLVLTGDPSWRPGNPLEKFLSKVVQLLVDNTGFHLYHSEEDLLKMITDVGYAPLFAWLSEVQSKPETQLAVHASTTPETQREIKAVLKQFLKALDVGAASDDEEEGGAAAESQTQGPSEPTKHPAPFRKCFP